MTSTIKTHEHLRQWIAADLFDDPAECVCLLFFRWVDRPETYRGPDLVCGNLVNGIMDLWIGPNSIPIPIHAGEQHLTPAGQLESFGVEPIKPGFWAISPSLNIPGEMHGFVVLYDVPEPAPFPERARELAAVGPKIWQPGDI